MATFLMFGNYSAAALKAISAKRSDEAQALISRYGGEFRAAYALLGDVDLVVILEAPDTEHAMRISAELTKLLGISFRTAPAVTLEEFDRLMA